MSPPIITSAGQTRSRLPTKWMQNATTKSRAASTTKEADLDLSFNDPPVPVRWSTHTLAADSHDTTRSRADSTTSTCVDTFAHRRRNRVSDLTFVDLLDDAPPTLLARSESHASSLNDLSATLNNDEDEQMADLSDLTKYKTLLKDANHVDALYTPNPPTDSLRHNDDDVDYDDDVMARRMDRLMAATMEALEASNRLVLDTLSSRAKLAQLNAMEAALDSHLDAREAHLRRQIQAVTDMTDFVSKTSAELQKLTSPASGLRHPSGGASTSQLTALADPAEVHVRDAAATGIVQALDRDATIGKTAAKRLERMLQTPSPTASPPSAIAAQRRNNITSSRRAFSISNFSSVQSSIAEETTPEKAATSTDVPGSGRQSSGSAADAPSESSTTTPQKKRSVSHDSRASGAMKLMTKLGAPTVVSTSGPVSSPTVSNGPALVAVTTTAAERPRTDAPGSDGSRQTLMRPSLMATLRQDVSSVASSQPTVLSKTAVREDDAKRSQTNRSGPGQPSHAHTSTSKSSAAAGVASTAAESTLAALLGMPSAVASASSRVETPSDSSYFDSVMEDSISSASPPTPGSMHAIHDVISTPWKPANDNQNHHSNDLPGQQQRSARRASVYSNLVSPTASLSLSFSDRDRAHQLSSQLSELRAERVTWNAQSARTDESSTASGSTSGNGASGGGALRALQKLNERSAAKIAGHSGASADEGGSKRASLGLGLPSFSALRPSASRSVSTNAASVQTSTATSSVPPPSAADEASAPATATSAANLNAAVDAPASAADTRPAAEVASPSLLGGGWRSWTSWTAPAVVDNGEATTPQK